MKIEMFNKEYYIFISKYYIDKIDYSDKNSVGEVVKDYLFRYKDKLNLNGFYKVKVYSNKYVGLFLEINCLEESEYLNNLDLRVLVYLDEDIYFCCDDYFLISNFNKIYHYDDKFFGYVDKDVDVGLLEFGNYIYNFGGKGILVK